MDGSSHFSAYDFAGMYCEPPTQNLTFLFLYFLSFLNAFRSTMQEAIKFHQIHCLFNVVHVLVFSSMRIADA